jgi:predicted transcriptional regulator
MITQNKAVLEHRKIQLIAMITQLDDSGVLDSIENLLLESKKDWWDTISEAEKKAIDQGLDDIKNGRVIPHEQVMKEFDERFKAL